eukprot:TRINITY_DN6538_c1_g1_i1.p1 TRINITY_DN6538_c1_g1~~TRINITY_DN6538_c1_g1_i1.p1  ORF type:complete len:1174 (-),score=283.22 TRINITY_DN6538_c1_g1_i1:452-3973(-)
MASKTTGAATAAPTSTAMAASMPDMLCRVSLKNPIIFSALAWFFACVGYAVWQVPEAPLTSPELLHEQLQRRIKAIPVPTETPRYQQYKQYYIHQYDQQMQEYKIQLAEWQRSNTQFNWRALLQGLGAGAMAFASVLACLEYHFGAISYWMEASEKLWCDVRDRWQKHQVKKRQLVESEKMERLLQEMGEGQEDQAAGCKGLAKRERKKVHQPSSSENSPSGVGCPPANTSAHWPSAPSVATAPTTPAVSAAEARAKPRQPCTPDAHSIRGSCPTMPTPDENASKNNQPVHSSSSVPEVPVPDTLMTPGKADAQLLFPTDGGHIPVSQARAGMQTTWPSEANAGSNMRERLRRKVIERQLHSANSPADAIKADTSGRHESMESPKTVGGTAVKKLKKETEVQSKVPKVQKTQEPSKHQQSPAALQQQQQQQPKKDITSTPNAQSSTHGAGSKAIKMVASKTSAGAESSPAIAKLTGTTAHAATVPLSTNLLGASSLRGAELLREAEELLSRLEGEDLLRELETEEEKAKRTAGKKKAKKNKAAAAKVCASSSANHSTLEPVDRVLTHNDVEQVVAETADKEVASSCSTADPASNDKLDESTGSRSTDEKDDDNDGNKDENEEEDQEEEEEFDRTSTGHFSIGQSSSRESAAMEKLVPLQTRTRGKMAALSAGRDVSPSLASTRAPGSSAELSPPAMCHAGSPTAPESSDVRASWADMEDETVCKESREATPCTGKAKSSNATKLPSKSSITSPMKSEKPAPLVPPKGRAPVHVKQQSQQPPNRVSVAAPRPHAATARQRPTNYAEAASGKSVRDGIASEASSLLASMGVSNSYDDLLEFLYTNSSEEWRKANMPREAATYNLHQLQRLAEALLQSFTVQESVATVGNPKNPRSNFDGAKAGARILEWVQGGDTRKDTNKDHSVGAATVEQQRLSQAKREQLHQRREQREQREQNEQHEQGEQREQREQLEQREQHEQSQQHVQCQQQQCPAEEQWDCTWQSSQYYDQMADGKQWSQDACGNWYLKEDEFAACKPGALENSHLLSDDEMKREILRSDFVPEVMPQVAPMAMALPPGYQIVMVPWHLAQGMQMYNGSLCDGMQKPMQAMHAVPAGMQAGMQLVVMPFHQAQAFAFEQAQAQAMMGQQPCPQELQVHQLELHEEQGAHHYDTDDEN